MFKNEKLGFEPSQIQRQLTTEKKLMRLELENESLTQDLQTRDITERRLMEEIGRLKEDNDKLKRSELKNESLKQDLQARDITERRLMEEIRRLKEDNDKLQVYQEENRVLSELVGKLTGEQAANISLKNEEILGFLCEENAKLNAKLRHRGEALNSAVVSPKYKYTPGSSSFGGFASAALLSPPPSLNVLLCSESKSREANSSRV